VLPRRTILAAIFIIDYEVTVLFDKDYKAKMFQRKGGGWGEGDLPMVWIFSLSLKATMEEIEGEELVYI
jgi:hypothetical protein